jgi:hypothetical protein
MAIDLSLQKFMGHSRYFYLGAADPIETNLFWPIGARLIVFHVEGLNNRRIRLPDATLLPLGGPHFYFFNIGPSTTFNGLLLFSHTGGQVSDPGIEVGQLAIVSLYDNSTVNGGWGVKVIQNVNHRVMT